MEKSRSVFYLVPINDSSDYAYGYDVMMAKKIADELGYELQIVKLDWDSLVPAVQSGAELFPWIPAAVGRTEAACGYRPGPGHGAGGAAL